MRTTAQAEGPAPYWHVQLESRSIKDGGEIRRCGARWTLARIEISAYTGWGEIQACAERGSWPLA